ncbi:hypothetical protein GCM10028789_18140 [Sinomonas halotolerans]
MKVFQLAEVGRGDAVPPAVPEGDADAGPALFPPDGVAPAVPDATPVQTGLAGAPPHPERRTTPTRAAAVSGHRRGLAERLGLEGRAGLVERQADPDARERRASMRPTLANRPGTRAAWCEHAQGRGWPTAIRPSALSGEPPCRPRSRGADRLDTLL